MAAPIRGPDPPNEARPGGAGTPPKAATQNREHNFHIARARRRQGPIRRPSATELRAARGLWGWRP